MNCFSNCIVSPSQTGLPATCLWTNSERLLAKADRLFAANSWSFPESHVGRAKQADLTWPLSEEARRKEAWNCEHTICHLLSSGMQCTTKPKKGCVEQSRSEHCPPWLAVHQRQWCKKGGVEQQFKRRLTQPWCQGVWGDPKQIRKGSKNQNPSNRLLLNVLGFNNPKINKIK